MSENRIQSIDEAITEENAKIEHQKLVNAATLDILQEFYGSIDRAFAKYRTFNFVDTVTISSNVFNSLVLGQLDMISNAEGGSEALVKACQHAWTEKLYLLMNDIKNYGKEEEKDEDNQTQDN